MRWGVERRSHEQHSKHKSAFEIPGVVKMASWSSNAFIYTHIRNPSQSKRKKKHRSQAANEKKTKTRHHQSISSKCFGRPPEHKENTRKAKPFPSNQPVHPFRPPSPSKASQPASHGSERIAVPLSSFFCSYEVCRRNPIEKMACILNHPRSACVLARDVTCISI